MAFLAGSSPTPSNSADTTHSENSSECPDELYNLTKLAEVSLAAAAGKIFEGRHLSVHSRSPDDIITYTHKLFDKSSRTPRSHIITVSLPDLIIKYKLNSFLVSRTIPLL